jgi:hypothetical protein
VEELKIIARTGWRTDNLLSEIAAENPCRKLQSGFPSHWRKQPVSGYRYCHLPGEFRQLLNKAIELCGGRKSGVFVLSIPDYGYTPFGEGARATISAEIDEYNRINREIASELGVAYFTYHAHQPRGRCQARIFRLRPVASQR